jgi:hypothetical protein
MHHPCGGGSRAAPTIPRDRLFFLLQFAQYLVLMLAEAWRVASKRARRSRESDRYSKLPDLAFRRMLAQFEEAGLPADARPRAGLRVP